MNTLSCTDPGLDIRAAVGTWDHNISGGDNALHINAGLLQVVDRESHT